MTHIFEHYEIIRRPHITEKSATIQDLCNQYVFLVHPQANKLQIRRAVESLFSVKVRAVNTVTRQGKVRRVGLRMGRRPAIKKAIVTLEKGQSIQLHS